MNIRLQMLVVIILVLGISFVLNRVKSGKVDLRYALIWLLIGVLFLGFDLIPGLQVGLSELLGISSTQNMIIFLSIGFLLIILFNQTVIVSQQTKRIERLIQENALMAEEVEKIKRKNEHL